MKMRRWAFSACVLAIVAFCATANAQQIPAAFPQPQQVAKQVWDYFSQQCGHAISDPQGFVDSVPNPDALGNPSKARSPDSHVMSLSMISEARTVIVYATIFASVGGLTVECGAAYRDEERLLAFATDQIWANPSSAQFALYVSAMTETARSYISSTTGSKVLGGLLQDNDDPRTGRLFGAPDTGLLVTNTKVGGLDKIVVLETNAGSITASVRHFEQWP